MEFELLADRPEAIHLVSHWYFQQWGHLHPGITEEGIASKISRSMNRDKPPLLSLAVEEGILIAAAELKFREMAIYPDLEHWLGGLFVVPHKRGCGVGSKLVEQIIKLAEKFNIRELYLQTEKLDGGLYSRHGWIPFERVSYQGTLVLVMQRQIGCSKSETVN